MEGQRNDMAGTLAWSITASNAAACTSLTSDSLDIISMDNNGTLCHQHAKSTSKL
jgi:hypothetical protein